MKKFLQSIRKTLLAGLLVLAPISLTVWVMYKLLLFFDGLLRGPFINFVSQKMFNQPASLDFPGIGILALLLLFLVAGTIARNYFGHRLFSTGEYIVKHIPIVNRIYIALREISEAVFAEKRETFKKAVLFEYPRKGLYAIGFFTQDTRGPVQESIDEDVVSVFLPTTPVPTSGFLLFVPKMDIKELNMTVEEALKLVISGGSINIKSKIAENLPLKNPSNSSRKAAL